MGLNISHGTFDKSYGTFHRFRIVVSKHAGFPPLDLMDGFFEPHSNYRTAPTFFNDSLEPNWRIKELEKSLPIKWDLLSNKPLIALLSHSDCDGFINYGMAKRIAIELEKMRNSILNSDDKEWIPVLEQFIQGCYKAYNFKEKLLFR